MKQRAKSIVGLGAIVVDQQMILDQVPAENEKERAREYREQIGGPVPTALVLLRRFGFDCHLVSQWGVDLNGAAIENDLAREGVAWNECCRATGCATQVAHVWSSSRSGSRTIVAGPVSWEKSELNAADQHSLKTCDLLHLDGHGKSMAVNAALIAATNDGRVVVDAGAPKEATEQLIPLADVFSFPERFAQQFFDDADPERAGAKILQLGAKAALCTRGEQGVIVFTPSGTTHVPAFPVPTVDSAGAGDVFCGATIAGLLQGLALDQAAQMGAAAAALKCRMQGNRDALPTLDDVQQLMGS